MSVSFTLSASSLSTFWIALATFGTRSASSLFHSFYMHFLVYIDQTGVYKVFNGFFSVRWLIQTHHFGKGLTLNLRKRRLNQRRRITPLEPKLTRSGIPSSTPLSKGGHERQAEPKLTRSQSGMRPGPDQVSFGSIPYADLDLGPLPPVAPAAGAWHRNAGPNIGAVLSTSNSKATSKADG